MGNMGERWYVDLGWPAERVFPFAYITDRPALGRTDQRVDERGVRILFVGKFITRKGGDILLRALAGIMDRQWECVLVGRGNRRPAWGRISSEYGIAERVSFCPPVDMKEVSELIVESDFLVLPSRFDGWGAVVNEALMCGVPVVCSDKCGAADLLRETWRGETFNAGSVQSLRSVLRRWIERGKLQADCSARISEWSAAIDGDHAAQYLLDILGYPQKGGRRPSPPWY
jgi:glycosyltransferase involved in cell wall biosynthesis